MIESELYVSFHTPRKVPDPQPKDGAAMWGTQRQLESCPFTTHEGVGGEYVQSCRLTKKPCSFALTEIRVPGDCPLRTRFILVQLKPEDAPDHGSHE